MDRVSQPAPPQPYVEAYKKRCLGVLDQISGPDLAHLIDNIRRAREEDRQIFLIGNGGSGSTASHFATDLGKGASLGRHKRFRVMALTDNMAWITAMANDTDYAQIFVEQLKNFARLGDLLLAFSGSGNSPNIVCCVEWANEHGLLTFGLTGRPGGKLARLARHPLFIESSHMGHIEEGHFLIQHLIGYYFMETEPAGA